jgi:DNA-binding NtrC family response regulator
MNKILVIEDHNEIRENIVEILKLADYEVSVAKMVRKGSKWLH